MRLAVPTALCTIVLAASAQSSLPTCAQSCARPPSKCNNEDVSCMCGDADFIDNLACCVSKTCSASDQTSALEFMQNICSTVDVVVPTAVNCLVTLGGGPTSSFSNSELSFLTQTNSLGVVTGQPSVLTSQSNSILSTTNSLGVVTGQPSVVTTQPSAVTTQEGFSTTHSSITSSLSTPLSTSESLSADSTTAQSSQTPSTSADAASGTSAPSSTPTETSGSSLSSSTKIGIGVGVGIGGTVLVGVVGYLVWKVFAQRKAHAMAMSRERGWEPGIVSNDKPGVARNY